MDIASLSLCLDVFDDVMHSPLGRAVECFLTNHKIPISLGTLRQKLSQGEYPTVTAYFSDIDSTVQQSVRFFSPDSDVAIALFTLQQIIRERTERRLSPGSRDFKASLTEFTRKISEFTRRAPDTKARFKDFTRVRVPEEAEEEYPVESGPDVSDIDLHRLKAVLQRLPRDEDEREVFSILSRYEPDLVTRKDHVDVDLRKLYPETLVMVRDAVEGKVELPDHVSTPATPQQRVNFNSPVIGDAWLSISPGSPARSFSLSAIPTPVPTPKDAFSRNDPPLVSRPDAE